MSGPWWEASDGALDGGFRGRPLVGDVAWGTSDGDLLGGLCGRSLVEDLRWGGLMGGL